ncbi:MAG: response regulator [Planctomycetales bacterium]|nr:response regulator [Planctomycetales bacterium]
MPNGTGWAKQFDCLIPGEIRRRGYEELAAARLLVTAVFSIVSGSFVLPMIAGRHFGDFHLRCAAGLGVLTSLALPLLWLTRNLAVASHLPVMALVVTLSTAMTFGDGLHGFSLVLVGAIPILSALLCGTRAAIGWSGAMLIFLMVNGATRWQSGDQETAALQWYTGAAMCAHLVFAIVFSSQREHAEQQIRIRHGEQLAQRDQLRRSEKFESLGAMASGIAHDFNNILAAIVANAEVGKLKAKQGIASADEVEAILFASRRAAKLIKSLLDFAGRGFRRLESVNLGELVSSVTRMMRVSTRHQLLVSERSKPHYVKGDPGELQQVVLNLIVNASEAYNEAFGEDNRRGVIELTYGTLGWREIRDWNPLIEAELSESRYAYIRCVDHGLGVPLEQRQRIFDPFFTTKKTGTGLGLASVIGIVRAHSGAIHFDETPGGGATFTVLLPVGTPHVSPAAVAEQRNQPLPDHLHVLVIDDDPSVVHSTSLLLSAAGCEVKAARSGDEALERSDLHEMQLAVLDVEMPGISGEPLIAALRERAPNLPLVLISGRSPNDMFQRLDGSGIAFVQKPFQYSSLMAAMCDALSQRSAYGPPHPHIAANPASAASSESTTSPDPQG